MFFVSMHCVLEAHNVFLCVQSLAKITTAVTEKKKYNIPLLNVVVWKYKVEI